ncbi:MAG: hypothetical protein HKN80_00480 [Acidimicrobiia bacterium]|nr:hypothetical protein [Acidimicrobiia bacterium]
MAVGRAERRADRRRRAESLFGAEKGSVALDLLELTELAWHDCYGEASPPEDIIEDMLLLSAGNLERLIQAALLAVTDWRDLRVAADEIRNRA